MRIEIDHPTDRPNFSVVTIEGVELAFSYQTLIGVRGPGTPSIFRWTVRENEWGPTTGKHLNDLNNTGTAHGRVGEWNGGCQVSDRGNAWYRGHMIDNLDKLIALVTDEYGMPADLTTEDREMLADTLDDTRRLVEGITA